MPVSQNHHDAVNREWREKCEEIQAEANRLKQENQEYHRSMEDAQAQINRLLEEAERQTAARVAAMAESPPAEPTEPLGEGITVYLKSGKVLHYPEAQRGAAENGALYLLKRSGVNSSGDVAAFNLDKVQRWETSSPKKVER